MVQLLQQLILDGQDQPHFTGIRRRLSVQVVSNKATVIMGVRRCGKSTFLHQIQNNLSTQGINKDNILYLNFFDDRLSGLKHTGLDPVHEAYFTLYPGKKNTEKIYCFFDEIQVMPGWEKFIDRMMRTENCDIYLSGSSATMLSKEIATQMRGRALSWELFPFSFREFLDFHEVTDDFPFATSQKLKVQNVFANFWQQGGFPEVAEVDRQIRIKIHQEYFNSLLYYDLIERYDIPHPKAIVDLARKLTDNVSSLFSLNSLTNYLKLLGHNTPKNAVADYLTWFEDAYFLFTVRKFDASFSRSNANPKKIYCIDHSLVNSVTSNILVNSGHLFENLVFTSLRRKFTEIYYYKTEKNQEVDFLVITPDREKILFQVSETLANPNTRNREINSLIQAMNELECTESVVVTMYEEETLLKLNKNIRILPAWKFLLEMS
jgi:uncharacterized protein